MSFLVSVTTHQLSASGKALNVFILGSHFFFSIIHLSLYYLIALKRKKRNDVKREDDNFLSFILYFYNEYKYTSLLICLESNLQGLTLTFPRILVNLILLWFNESTRTSLFSFTLEVTDDRSRKKSYSLNTHSLDKHTRHSEPRPSIRPLMKCVCKRENSIFSYHFKSSFILVWLHHSSILYSSLPFILIVFHPSHHFLPFSVLYLQSTTSSHRAISGSTIFPNFTVDDCHRVMRKLPVIPHSHFVASSSATNVHCHFLSVFCTWKENTKRQRGTGSTQVFLFIVKGVSAKQYGNAVVQRGQGVDEGMGVRSWIRRKRSWISMKITP